MLQKCILLYCGIQPSEIDNLEMEEVEAFMAFYNEIKRAESGEK
jgi:hypothetical protein